MSDIEVADVVVTTLSGDAIEPWMSALARLRIRVFREFPYLYEGTEAYEEKYLRAYAASHRSLFVLALLGDEVMGVSTAIPLEDAEPVFREPFVARGIDPATVLYFGESVLAPECRGKGLGHRFFDAREAYARAIGRSITSFCAVERPEDHPAKPVGYRPLHAFWTQRGYVYQPDMHIEYSWLDVGDTDETLKPMRFWLRRNNS